MDSSTSTPKEDTVFNEDTLSSSSTVNWLRGPKLNGIAAFDLVATAVGAFMLSGTIKLLDRFKGYTHVLVIFILLIMLAIGVHYAMEIPTMMNHYLGINTLEEVTDSRNSRGEH
jgi:hypothetical protein